MSGDIYDLANGPRNPHKVRHNGQARYEREQADRRLEAPEAPQPANR